MKLFKCSNPECRPYPLEADCRAIGPARALIQHSDILKVFPYNEDGDSYDGYTAITTENSFRCQECEGPVDLIDVVECPHDWYVLRDASLRQCTLCGKR